MTFVKKCNHMGSASLEILQIKKPGRHLELQLQKGEPSHLRFQCEKSSYSITDIVVLHVMTYLRHKSRRRVIGTRNSVP